MIPQHLIIKGLYSYKNQQEIDFNNLTSASLFGIFGSVGSGKSSVLEAIMFALYGDTERLNKSGDERYYNMTNLSSDELIIDFTCLAGKEDNKYRFFVRGRRSRRNFKEVNIERKAYQWMNDNWSPITTDDVAEKVIGLSYENFRRTVIIPQGNFQEFIELKGKERSEMMKVLFGLEKFDLFEKNKRLIERNNAELSVLDGQLLSLGDETQEAIEQREHDLKLKREFSKSIDIQLQQLRKDEKQQEELLKLFSNLTHTTHKLDTLKEQENWFRQRDERLKLYEKCVINFKSLFEQKASKEADYKRDKTESDRNQIILSQNQLRLQTIQHELDTIKPDYEKREEHLAKAKELDVLKGLRNLEQERLKAQQRIANGKTKLQEKELFIQNLLNEKNLLEQNLDKRKEEIRLQKIESKLDEELLHLKVQKSLQQFADALKDSEPCPLCGSVHHPDVLSSNEDFDSKINQLTTQKENLRTELVSAENAIKKLFLTIEGENNDKVERYEKTLNTLIGQLAGFEGQKTILLNQLSIFKWVDFEQKNLEEIETQRLYTETHLKRVVETFNRLDVEHRTAEGNIKGIEGSQKTLLANLENHTKDLALIEKSIAEQLKVDDFESAEAVLAILKQNILIDRERIEIQTFQTDLQATQQALEQLTKDTEGKRYEPERHHLIKDTIKNNEARFNELKKEEGSLEKEIESGKENLKNKQRLLAEKKRLEIRKDNLDTLYKLFKANGFVDFVSSIYLKNLSHAANERFHRMTRHQLHLEVNADNDFEVRDLLNGGKTRLLKTLSGGQKFQAALSLALALADNIHTRVQSKHNFFFLDEGFGSLDRESLLIVFETLKSLRKENRIVGIISHVDELQQEIQTFLKVENTEDGSKVSTSW
ncbi:SbcC/MukB-like Walker B domain-containing protein [Emticicia sp. BO119]|uniref:SbcC/MukB-like Walker B domain-containing protein n=1 Tax=Emticicia sp. BO119 TaxID=2757768 RepID=UPI0015F036A1|nr:SMC family ATPase [Emticicia sp. BO119]MBA4851797.1 SMC family ATPase [Emticicia sp. BO119]